MGIRLLSASTNPPAPPGAIEVSTGLVAVTSGVLAARLNKGNDIARPDDTYVWSSTAGGNRSNRIYGTPVEDSHTQRASDGEYVSGGGSIPPIARSAVAHYLMYARFSVGNGQLIDLYA
ncbi:MAG TPA: hypothetical protein VIH89_03570 [Candidatus Sulfotelmatobacter sp.]|jgi:hypothetical protein